MMQMPGPYTISKRDWIHNVVRQVKDVRQVNLPLQLEDEKDRQGPYNSKLPTYEPFPGFQQEDFPDLQALQVCFMTRYRIKPEEACDLVSSQLPSRPLRLTDLPYSTSSNNS